GRLGPGRARGVRAVPDGGSGGPAWRERAHDPGGLLLQGAGRHAGAGPRRAVCDARPLSPSRWRRGPSRRHARCLVTARWLAPLCLLLSCSLWRPHAAARHEHRHGPGGPPTAAAKPPEHVTLVKMISWAEPASSPCETDLEGSAPPAGF